MQDLTGFGGEVDTATLLAKQIQLQGLLVGSLRQQQEFILAIDTMGLNPVIERTFALEELVQVFCHQDLHCGKISIALGDVS